MFKHCGYNQMFKKNSLFKFNEKLNYDLESFMVTDGPPNFRPLKENKTWCWLNSCLSMFLILNNIIPNLPPLKMELKR